MAAAVMSGTTGMGKIAVLPCTLLLEPYILLTLRLLQPHMHPLLLSQTVCPPAGFALGTISACYASGYECVFCITCHLFCFSHLQIR